MKRLCIFVFTILMILSMVGCELITPTPDVTSDIITTEPAVVTTTEPPVDDISSGTNRTLTQFGIQFVVDYATLNDTNPIIGITITNNTDNEISIQSSNCTINYLGVAGIFGITVPAHSTASGTMTFNTDEIIAHEIYSIKFIEFTYRIYSEADTDTDSIIDTEAVELIF